MKQLVRLLPIALLLALGGLTLSSYRELPGRAFAADDYQWLLSVRDLTPAELLQQAFDPLAQQHFYRPLIWALFWVQVQIFGLNPYGFHLVSLGLHLLNALLIGLLAVRSTARTDRTADIQPIAGHAKILACTLASGFVICHPAPFEAIVWISAQSELLGTCLLLLAVHVWLLPRSSDAALSTNPWWSVIGATSLLGLAMLAKESAILGLPFMLLLTYPWLRQRRYYLPPLLLTLAFIGLQLFVGQQNRVLREGLYGFGTQLISNPLRSLALIVVPLPGTEHADTTWLVPVGALIALIGLGILISDLRRAHMHLTPVILALILSLAPTAPFTSPPDSRYLYIPVALLALLIGRMSSSFWQRSLSVPTTADQRSGAYARSGLLWRSLIVAVCSMALWWGSSELAVREWRFSAGSGPGGSLWRLANTICATQSPKRMIMVEPPIAAPHVEAIIQLACGTNTRTLIVGRDAIQSAIRTGSVVIGFPGGSATIEQQT